MTLSGSPRTADPLGWRLGRQFSRSNYFTKQAEVEEEKIVLNMSRHKASDMIEYPIPTNKLLSRACQLVKRADGALNSGIPISFPTSNKVNCAGLDSDN